MLGLKVGGLETSPGRGTYRGLKIMAKPAAMVAAVGHSGEFNCVINVAYHIMQDDTGEHHTCRIGGHRYPRIVVKADQHQTV